MFQNKLHYKVGATFDWLSDWVQTFLIFELVKFVITSISDFEFSGIKRVGVLTILTAD